MATVTGIEFEIKGVADDAINSIHKLSSALKQLNRLGSNDMGLGRVAFQIKSFTQDLEKIKKIKSIEQLGNALKGLSSFGSAMSRLGKNTASIDAFANAMYKISLLDFTNLNEAAASISTIMSVTKQAGSGASKTASDLAETGRSASRASTWINEMRTALSKLTGAIKTVSKLSLSKMFDAFKWSASGMLAPIKAVGNAISGLGNRLKRLIIMRTFRAMIRAVTAAFKEGINNLYAWSNAMGGEFASSMDRCSTALAYLKNSLGAVAAPIVNALAPALDFVVDKIVLFLNALNQLIAKLTGASYWTRAKKAATAYGGAASDAIGGVGSAAKEALKYLAPFDEINKFPEDSGSGGGGGGGSGSGGTNASDLFEEMVSFDSAVTDFANMIRNAWEQADFTEVGQLVATKLKNALDNINWTGIQSTCNRIATSLATFINGFVETPGLWSTVGRTIGEGINTAVGMWNTFFDTTRFDSIGSGIATALNTALGTIDAFELGRALSQKIKAAIDFAYGFLVGGENGQGGFDFKNFGTWLGEAVNGFFENIDLSMAGTALATAITGVIDAAIAFLKTTNWGDIANNIVGGISSAISGISNWFSTTDWDQLGTDIYNGIKDTINNEVDWDTLASTFSTLAGSMLSATVKILVSFASNAWKDLKAEFDSRMEEYEGSAIKVAISFAIDILSLPENLKQWIDENIVTPFKNAATEAFGIDENSKLFSVGEGVTGGLLSGMVSAIPGVGALFWVVEFLNKIKDGIAAAFGIGSPAVEMKPTGGWIGEGILEGIKEKFSLSSLTAWIQTNIFDPFANAIKSLFKQNEIKVAPKITVDETGFGGSSGGTFGGTYTLKGEVDPSFKQMQTEYKSIKDKSPTTTLWGKIGGSFKSIRTEYNNIHPKAPVTTLWGKIGDSFKTIKTEYANIHPKAPTTTLWGAIGDSFKTIKTEYNNIHPKAPTTTLWGKIGDSFASAKKSYDAAKDKTVTVTYKANGVSYGGGIYGYTKANGGVFSGGKWHDIARYASGGLPSGSQLFWARESGPELVGTLGGHTAVMNNDQIVASVSAGVARAIAGIRFKMTGLSSAQTDEDTLYRAFMRALTDADVGATYLDGEQIARSTADVYRRQTRAGQVPLAGVV